MSALEPQAVRQRIATAVAAIDGFNQATRAFDWFGLESRHLQHQGFAVGYTDDAPDPGITQQRQRPASAGVRVQATLQVAWSFRLRDDNHRADSDAGLESSRDVIAAVMGMDRSGLHVSYTGLEAESLITESAQSYQQFTATFAVTYRRHLEAA